MAIPLDWLRASREKWRKRRADAQARIDLRNRQIEAEKVRLAAEHSSHVAPPLKKVLADSWGYHPPVHDGIDLICEPHATLYAMCDGEIIRADTGGWWGKAPSGDVSKGDGIVVLRCTVDAGPFRKGLNICYGHAENPKVKVGQKVKAGKPIAEAGLAVAWHTHLMVNGRKDDRGVGDRDPRPYYDFARRAGGKAA